MKKTLNKEEAQYCANVFSNYFDQFTRIDEYMRDQKMAQIESIPTALPGMGLETELFNDFTMSPEDMDLEVAELDNHTWDTCINMISSHSNMVSIPGKSLKLAVKEKKTNTYVGFMRFGSPVINMRPRNILLGNVPDLKVFNKTAIMGFVIVPSQPFGFNYLGGKLLSAICTSHTVREICNKKYGMDLCLFETTSLYGSTKQVSQYDGMKPYIRFKGLTESDMVPMMHGDRYNTLKDYVEDKVGDLLGGDESTTSRKLRSFTKIIALTKAALKGTDEGLAFSLTIENAKRLTEKKRYYVSDYGFSNMVDYMNCKADQLVKGENYEKHELVNIIEWWRSKAINRYDTLKTEGRLRTELEVWTSGKTIQIIR